MSETGQIDTAKIDGLRKQAFDLTPREQYRLAWFIAENINYILSTRDLPDELTRLQQDKAALVELDRIPTSLFWLIGKGKVHASEPLFACQIIEPSTGDAIAESEHDDLGRAIKLAVDLVAELPCEYCGPGKSTGLPSGACENCMNSGLRYPQLSALASQ